jgi:hypothetical protein
MIVAVYRVLYGEDFIVESIQSILEHVDRIVVVIAPRPWGSSKGVSFHGVWRPWPQQFDDLQGMVTRNFRNVLIVEDFYPTPFSQHDHIVQNVLTPRGLLPADVVFIEPDHVFVDAEAGATFARWRASDSRAGATSQVELWAPPGYKPVWRVPERAGRSSVLFYRSIAPGSKLPPIPPVEIVGEVHNLGFCFSAETMLWKHLTAMAYSKEIGDCMPNPDWYDGKWLSWHPETNNANLEITATLEHLIPRVVPYDAYLLPESIRRRYGL